MVDVAQLVESRIVIPVVVGSSPIVHPKLRLVFGTDLVPCTTGFGPLAQLVEQLTLNQLVVGSSPTRPTIQYSKCIPSSVVDRPEELYRKPVPILEWALSCILAFSCSALICTRALWLSWRIAFLTAKVAELVDALDLGSSGVTRESSTLSFRTIHARNIQKNELIHVMMGTYDRWVYPYNPITGF